MGKLSVEEFASTLEYTRVKGTDNIDEVKKVCAEALENSFGAVCVNPFFVAEAHRLLRSSSVEVCTGIGFPLGASLLDVKIKEIKEVISLGADAVDFVINVGALKSGMYDVIKNEMEALVKESRRAITKVILETCYLTPEEITKVSQIAAEAGAEYIKTSTGMGPRGASLKDVQLIKAAVNGRCKIKASGGIKTLEQALALIDAGASRIGTSGGVELVNEYKKRYE